MATLYTANSDAAIEDVVETKPYPPSWMDRLTDWVRSLKVPYWIVYLIPALVLFLITSAINWGDGTYSTAYEAGNRAGLYKVGPFYFYPFHAVPELVAFYALALIHYLDSVAHRALKTFRPALHIDEAHYLALDYRLTTLPARPTLLASLLGVLFAVCALAGITIFSPDLGARLLLFTSPAATIIDWGVFMLLWFIWGAVTYHTIRQLRLVSQIFAIYTDIDLFNLHPLYSFSWLTARTGIGWIIATYLYILTAPGLLENVITLGIMAFNFVFAIAAFGWPLVGIHRKLEAAKSERIYASNQAFESLSSELHRRIASNTLEEMPQIKDGLEAVSREVEFLDKIHTWPWQRETVGGLSTALVLPIILWLITRFLDRFL
ncbi:MAG TPA: hypothetical protein VLQ48_11685 [Chloroflexia bacterium]|nr:hypothetical protein [Chloroflexia bacterium]